MAKRSATKLRETKETRIEVKLGLDGSGQSSIATGLGFFDHMLEQLAHHSKLDLAVNAQGDLHVDGHHLVEDTGITLGKALSEAIGDKLLISRYGFSLTPMDESLVSVAVDISGRPYLFFDCPFSGQMVGAFDVQLVEEFFRALTTHAGLTVHIELIRGNNDHHKTEAIFKGFARALNMAVQSSDGCSSSKGMLEG